MVNIRSTRSDGVILMAQCGEPGTTPCGKYKTDNPSGYYAGIHPDNPLHPDSPYADEEEYLFFTDDKQPQGLQTAPQPRETNFALEDIIRAAATVLGLVVIFYLASTLGLVPAHGAPCTHARNGG